MRLCRSRLHMAYWSKGQGACFIPIEIVSWQSLKNASTINNCGRVSGLCVLVSVTHIYVGPGKGFICAPLRGMTYQIQIPLHHWQGGENESFLTKVSKIRWRSSSQGFTTLLMTLSALQVQDTNTQGNNGLFSITCISAGFTKTNREL